LLIAVNLLATTTQASDIMLLLLRFSTYQNIIRHLPGLLSGQRKKSISPIIIVGPGGELAVAEAKSLGDVAGAAPQGGGKGRGAAEKSAVAPARKPVDVDAGWERDLGPAAVQRRRAVGWQLGEELSNLGLVSGGRHALGPPAFVAREGCVNAADIACAPRVHPHAALVAADHLLAVVERDAAGTVHRPRAVHPVIGGVRGGDGRRRGRRRHGEVGLRRLRSVQAAAFHRRRAETLISGSMRNKLGGMLKTREWTWTPGGINWADSMGEIWIFDTSNMRLRVFDTIKMDFANLTLVKLTYQFH
jgi:hypothetical protein